MSKSLLHVFPYSGASGSKVTNWELIGVRSGYDFAELLLITNDENFLNDFIREGKNDSNLMGFDRYDVLNPGDPRPVDVFETPTTVKGFVGLHFDEFASDWLSKRGSQQ